MVGGNPSAGSGTGRRTAAADVADDDDEGPVEEKTEDLVLPPEPEEPIIVGTGSIRFPMRKPRAGHHSRKIDVHLNARQQKAAAYLVTAYEMQGEKTGTCRLVTNAASVVRKLFDIIADEVEKAEREHEPEMEAFRAKHLKWQQDCDRIRAEAAWKAEIEAKNAIAKKQAKRQSPDKLRK